ncbi:MAG: flavodoxin domain-containing protein [Candidatus Woesearchaeota archaeon]
MEKIIIYVSYHHNNTERIAKEIGSKLDAKLFTVSEVTIKDVENADLIGFGSGIYYSNFHESLIEFVKDLPEMKDKKAFLFSTSGMGKNFIFNKSHKHFKKLLKEKKFKVIDEFNCPGYDTYGFLNIFGGINKGRPNDDDLKDAKYFADNLD